MDSERQTSRAFSSSQQLRLAFTFLTFFALAWRMVAATLQLSVNIPYWDQWDFYTPLFNHASLWRIFTWQHGPHRQGIGLVADKFLLDWTSWSARAESLLIVGTFCAAAILAIYLKVKMFGRLSYFDAIIPCLFLMEAHMEAVTGISNPSYSGFPELLIVFYCLTWTVRNRSIRYPVVLLLNFISIYTGFGVFVGIITLGLLAFDLRRALRAKDSALLPGSALALALASFASFFYQYHSAPAKLFRCVEHPHILDYPWFVTLSFSLFLGIRRSVILASIVGSFATVVFIGVTFRHALNLWRERNWIDRDVVITVMAGFSLLFVTAAALGRVCLGMPGAAQSYRYLGLLVPAFLATYYHLQSVHNTRQKKAALTLFVVSVLPAALHHHASPQLENGKRAWMSCYLQSGSISECQQSTGFLLHPDPIGSHMQEKLDYLKRNRLSLFSPATDAHVR